LQTGRRQSRGHRLSISPAPGPRASAAWLRALWKKRSLGSTATRVAIAARVSRSWVTSTTVSPSSWCSARIRRTKLGAAVGVEPGGGFVEQQQLGLQRQRTRQRHALDHAARELGRHAAGVLRASSTIASLSSDQVVDLLRLITPSSRSGKAMFSNTVKAENSAPCWNSTP
jgi:TctA family transporter